MVFLPQHVPNCVNTSVSGNGRVKTIATPLLLVLHVQNHVNTVVLGFSVSKTFICWARFVFTTWQKDDFRGT